jgi:hypothetical protein
LSTAGLLNWILCTPAMDQARSTGRVHFRSKHGRRACRHRPPSARGHHSARCPRTCWIEPARVGREGRIGGLDDRQGREPAWTVAELGGDGSGGRFVRMLDLDNTGRSDRTRRVMAMGVRRCPRPGKAPPAGSPRGVAGAASVAMVEHSQVLLLREPTGPAVFLLYAAQTVKPGRRRGGRDWNVMTITRHR